VNNAALFAKEVLTTRRNDRGKVGKTRRRSVTPPAFSLKRREKKDIKITQKDLQTGDGGEG